MSYSRHVMILAVLLTVSAGAGCTPPSPRMGVMITPPCGEGDPIRIGVHWELHGRPVEAGAPVLLLFHGGPGAPPKDIAGQPFWREILRQTTVLVYHQRGAGRSGALEGRAAQASHVDCYRMRELAEDARRVADMVLGPERSVIPFGVSFGSQLALLFALAHPDRVSGLILVAPAADHRWVSAQRGHLREALEGSASASPAARAGLAALLGEEPPPCSGFDPDVIMFRLAGELGYTRRGQELVFDALVALGARRDPGPLCALLETQGVGKTALRSGDARLFSAAQFRTVACRELGWADVAATNCEGVGEELPRLDLRARLKEIRAPALILASRHDPIVPTRLSDEVWLALGGSATLVRMVGSGHVLLAEEPTRATAAVRAYLEPSAP